MLEKVLEEKLAIQTKQLEAPPEWQQKTVEPLLKNVKQHKRTSADVEVDEYGLMLHPERWNKEVASLLAQGEAVGALTVKHWQIIDYLRKYNLEFGIVPPVRLLEQRTGLSLKRIFELFPNGLAKGACRIAGIPSSVAMVQGYVGKGY